METKFKAWHTKLSKMFTTEEMVKDQMALLPDGRFCNVHGADTSLSTFPPMIPLQYSGIKDEEGEELYEGDIVTNAAARWEVIKSEGCFCGKMLGIGYEERKTHLALRAIRGIKKIGNRYENPELLNLASV